MGFLEVAADWDLLHLVAHGGDLLERANIEALGGDDQVVLVAVEPQIGISSLSLLAETAPVVSQFRIVAVEEIIVAQDASSLAPSVAWTVYEPPAAGAALVVLVEAEELFDEADALVPEPGTLMLWPGWRV